MLDELEAALRGLDADYVEARYEVAEATRIAYRGRELDDIGQTRSAGGCVRARVRGGWGFVSFNGTDDLAQRARLAVEQARAAAVEQTAWEPAPPVRDMVRPQIGKDPRQVGLAAKKELLDRYVDIIWSRPKIQTSTLRYADTARSVYFVNSEGSAIEQSRLDVVFGGSAMARDGDDVQQGTLSLGALNDFTFMETLDDQVREMADKAVAFLEAPYVDGGEYTVVLDPVLAGVFAHEAFGHLSESDFLYENPRMREIMTLGRRFGGTHLNIVDGAAVPGLRGSFAYDDEGTPARRTDLIREGVLVGRLHSRETAAVMGERPTGNARAIDYRFPPIVRMTNTFIEPGEATFDEMIGDVKLGIYAKNWYGGTTTMEQFTFSAGEAHMIRDGKVAELVRPVVLSGNLFVTLENLDLVGNDLHMSQGGGCGKGGQSPLPVSDGGPHVRIRNVLVGGR
jgi:TldD protein